MKTLRSASKLNLFPRIIQSRLNMFIFFLAFPAFSVLGNSITFFIFLDLIYRAGIRKVNFRGHHLFFAFFTVGLISSIFTPVIDRHPGIVSVIIILIQFLYWIGVTSFIIKNYSRIDLMQLSKWMFTGSLIYIFVFFIFPFNFNSGLVSIEFEPGRNGLIFNLLCTIPLSFYYIYQRWNKKGVLIFSFFFFVAMLFTNGRAGVIILLIQILLILNIVFVKIRKYFRFILICSIPIIVLFQSDKGLVLIEKLSYEVSKINEPLGKLILSNKTGSIERDKSWLQRKLLISKGKEIFFEHPFIGIGPNNFKYYDSELNSFSKFDFLQGNTREFYNGRSAHNSYMQILVEFGLIGFIFYIIILFRPIFLFRRNLLKATLKIEHLPIISLLGVAIHFYAISAFTGAITWMIIGLCWAQTTKLVRKK
jgi:O-antigen ligase